MYAKTIISGGPSTKVPLCALKGPKSAGYSRVGIYLPQEVHNNIDRGGLRFTMLEHSLYLLT